ncbi:condensin-2 complex subunit H2-like [Hibiscus syriacus]|uniref:Pectinesterase n=1 Tax=Hibiscus syriacus TaxID=106335 RepID=A0A6A3B6M2_HIBSY|nr:probable pectinesterase/pectinesterase inhibitor 21 [Hibiscus syriacus]KAE8711923.1 condensin-2 complex subunit H2-like [Hibiscus syriacus]
MADNNVAVISICSVLLVALVVAVMVGVTQDEESDVGGHSELQSSSKAIKDLCQPTDYEKTCEKSLENANTTDTKVLIRTGFKAAITELEDVIIRSVLLKDLVKDKPRARQALWNCKVLLQYAIDDLNDAFAQMRKLEMNRFDEYIENLKTWLAAVITHQETCLDGFVKTRGEGGAKTKELLKTSRELSSNALAMVYELDLALKKLDLPNMSHQMNTSGFSRRLLLHTDGLPPWFSSTQRKLLAKNITYDVKPNVVVAKDKSGDYTTIKAALKKVPKDSSVPFVIYIKAGVYNERLTINKHMRNVMFIGDGPKKTIITGSKNYRDGTSTYRTATVAVIGKRFMAKDIQIRNTAGAKKRQAVALRVQSDQSVFYNCKIDGYQNTLYVHSHRQFYRQCTVRGTVDFIFGDAAVVLQNCKIIIKKPLSRQDCTVTAQGRSERRELTAIVLHNCTISGTDAYKMVKNKNKAYLGRPWKEFSRTIIMQSYIDDVIDPKGWVRWDRDFGLHTAVYAEFENRGPGSNQTGRVKWKCIKRFSKRYVKLYTVGELLRGGEFIPKFGVPYSHGMIDGL